MKTNNEIKDIKNFFDGYSYAFDSIYSSDLTKRNSIQKIIDKNFRKSMFARYKLTFKYIQKFEVESILDIGCGSGIYANKLADDGYKVTGVDVAPKMIDLAKKYSKKSDNPQYEVSDFINMHDIKFDVSILMGFFDYVSDVNIVFEKLKKTTSKLILGSFPKDAGFLAFQRKIRYKIRNCPLYLYSKENLEQSVNKHFSNYEIIDNDREFFLIVKI
jgi:2-polyprenyl-3-methyl-5-hydroxy-6-metoxy-1,4-benzoquinol methylase